METFQKVLSKCFDNKKVDLRILVVGRAGHGKSALINSIIDRKQQVSEESASIKGCTPEVIDFSIVSSTKYPVTLFDSPGLQNITGNEEAFIQSMQNKCKELDLVLYCKNMTDFRKCDDDKQAMKKLTAKFGDEFWKHVIIVFTFANKEDCGTHNNIDEDNEYEEPDFNDEQNWKVLEKRRFVHRLEVRVKEFKEFLKSDIGIEPSIVNEMPIVPAGYYKGHKGHWSCLPDRENWLEDLLKKLCHHIKDNLKFARLDLNDSKLVTFHYFNCSITFTGFHLSVIIKNNVDDQDLSENNSIKVAFEKLGIGVLSFTNLSSCAIKLLVEKISEVNAFLYLLSFSLIVFSKENEDIGQYKVIFDYFAKDKLAKIPKFFIHVSRVDSKVEAFELPQLNRDSNCIALSICCNSQGAESIIKDEILKFYPDPVIITEVFESIKNKFEQIHASCSLKQMLTIDGFTLSFNCNTRNDE